MTKSRIYTRTGDDGTTSLVGGTRVAKNDIRLDAYGTVDELNSWIGLLASSSAVDDEQKAVLRGVSHRLFDIGAALATEATSPWQPQLPGDEGVKPLEDAIDSLDSALPPLRRFVLPGGHPDAARASIARTVARRAERRIHDLASTTAVAPFVFHYINRLSDYLFVLSRHINAANGCEEIFWDKNV